MFLQGMDVGGVKKSVSLGEVIRLVAFSMAIGSFTCLVQASPKSISIEQQSLSSALAELGKQTGAQIVYEASLVAGLRSTAVRGDMEIGEALNTLLAGTGLQFNQTNSTIIIFSSETGSALELGATSVVGVGDQTTVTEGTASYTVNEVSMAKGQKIKDIPQSVSVVTKQRIEDQGLQSVDDVLRQMPGVTAGGDLYNSGSGKYYSRGYAMSNVQVDGHMESTLNSYSEGGNSMSSLAMYDHVEVLRGADGLYSGAGDSSGTINLVRKKPLDYFQAKITSSAGNWDNYRSELDVTGPLGFEGRVRGRAVAVYQDRKYFYEYSESNGDFFMGL